MKKVLVLLMKGLFGLGFLVFLMLFSSCEENSGDVDEYQDWKGKNESYFQNVYLKADSVIHAGGNNWKIIRKWSLLEQFGDKKENNIVVHVLENGGASAMPIYTDSVVVDIEGRLMPATCDEKGAVFYTSFSGKDRNLKQDLMVTISAKGSLLNHEIDGLSTALQKMHIGDRWLIYVPSNLALQGQSLSSPFIPSYSTLIFDITLLGIKH